MSILTWKSRKGALGDCDLLKNLQIVKDACQRLWPVMTPDHAWRAISENHYEKSRTVFQRIYIYIYMYIYIKEFVYIARGFGF